jgi:hypothetical protein
MTCYQILIGKFPFESHFTSEYDLIFSTQCPMVPKYIEDWTCELLNRCWQSYPKVKLPIEDI